jgi:hypothetical protein
MQTVLKPNHFSGNVFKTLKYACQIFEYGGSEIFIVNDYNIKISQTVLGGSSFEELKMDNRESYLFCYPIFNPYYKNSIVVKDTLFGTPKQFEINKS